MESKVMKHMLWIGGLVILAVLLVSLWVIPRVYGRPTDPAQFGDMFGAANALFSGLALLGVVYTILLQSREIRQNQHEIAIAQELAAAAALFEYYNIKISSLRNAIAREAPDKSALTDLLGTDDFETKTTKLAELRVRHQIVQARLEDLYDQLSANTQKR
jgi:hypothetical protein